MGATSSTSLDCMGARRHPYYAWLLVCVSPCLKFQLVCLNLFGGWDVYKVTFIWLLAVVGVVGPFESKKKGKLKLGKLILL